MAAGPGRFMGGALPGDVTHSNEPMKPHTLLQAVNLKNMDAVQELLPRTASAQELDEVMDAVATKGDADMMKLLLTSSHVNVNGTSNDTPLFRAALGHHFDVMKLLLDHGANPDLGSKGLRSQGCVVVGVPEELSTPLHAVAGFDSISGLIRGSSLTKRVDAQQRANECCQLLLNAGCDPNARGLHENTPLHFCAASNLIMVADTLLKHGVDPFAVNDAGLIPLALVHPPQYSDNIDMIRLFVQYGGKLETPCGFDGDTVLHWLFRSKHDMNLDLIAPFVSDWNAVNKKGETVLHHMMTWTLLPSSRLMSQLIELGADVRYKDNEGIEPIYHIISRYDPSPWSDQRPIIRLLLGAGASIDAKDLQGRTALHRLIMERSIKTDGHEAVQAFVSEFNPNIHAVDNDGNGVLHFALREGPPSFGGHLNAWPPTLLTGLVSMGADPLLANHFGETVMHTLMMCNHAKNGKLPFNMLQLLFDYGISSASQDKDGNTPLHILCSTRLNSNMPDWLDDRGINLLLSSGGLDFLQLPNHAGVQPIHFAAADSNPLLLKLLAKGVSTSNQTMTSQNVLHFAASAREGNNIAQLIEDSREKKTLNILLNQRDGNGSTPLHEACNFGSMESVRLLVEAGADLEIQDATGATPLDVCHDIIDEVEKTSVQLLENNHTLRSIFKDIRLGCEPNSQPNDAGQMMEIICFLEQAMNKKPQLRAPYDLDIARLPFKYPLSRLTPVFLRGNYEAIQKLIDSGISFPLGSGAGHVHQSEQKSGDLLSQLVMGGYVFLFDMIAASLKDRDWLTGLNGVPPYIFTAASRREPNMAILRVLVEKYGADVNAKGSVWNCVWGYHDYGALHMLARGQNWWQKGAVQYFLDKGADPNLKDGYGRTPLRLAVISFINGAPFSKAIIKSLLDGGADPNLKDDQGLGPLDEDIGDNEVVELLKKVSREEQRGA
jgi:ankyrin repeat protein